MPEEFRVGYPHLDLEEDEESSGSEMKNKYDYWESVAGSVIQATGTLEFEDGLRTGVLPGGCWRP